MRSHKLSFALVTTLSVGTMLLSGLSGCGSKPVAVKKADGEIKAAKQALDSAKTMQSKGEWSLAIADVKAAQSKIKEGLAFATGPDKRNLDNLAEDASAALSLCETELIKKPKPLAASKDTSSDVVVVDLNAGKKKEEEEKKKKALLEAELHKKDLEAKAVLEAKPVPKAKNEDEDPVPAAPNSTRAGVGEEGVAAAVGGGEAKKPKSNGLFPAMTEKSPPLEVVKVTSSGKFCFAYFQVCNQSEDEHKILGHTVIFTDKDNAAMNRDMSVIVVPFDGFSEKAKDPTDNPNALTMSSHSVKGKSALTLVAVCEVEHANKVKKVGIRISYGSGPSAVGEGSTDAGAKEAKEEGGAAPPALKLKK